MSANSFPFALALFTVFVVPLLLVSPAYTQLSPLPFTESRITVAPHWTPGDSRIEMDSSLDMVLAYGNAVRVSAPLFQWRFEDEEGRDAGADVSRLEMAWEVLADKQARFILGLDCNTRGPRDELAWFEGKYPTVPVWQKNVSGHYADGRNGGLAFLSLAHPAVAGEMELAYKDAMQSLKAGRARPLLVGVTTSPSPMIATQGEVLPAGAAGNGRASGFDVNPEQIARWRSEFRKACEGDIVRLNRDLRTNYTSFDDIAAPVSFDVPTVLTLSYEQGLFQTVQAIQKWQHELLNTLDPEATVMSFGSVRRAFLDGGVRGSYSSFKSCAHSERLSNGAEPFVPGGDLCAPPGQIARGAALMMDGLRSYCTTAIAACRMDPPGADRATGEEYRLWFSQLAARFDQVYAMPDEWRDESTGAVREDAAAAFPWATHLGAIDVGAMRMPRVAVMISRTSWCAYGEKPWLNDIVAYQSLFENGIDRVLVDESQVMEGWLLEHKPEVLVLPSARAVPMAALEAIHGWQSEVTGAELIYTPQFAEKSSTLVASPEFTRLREEITASSGARSLDALDRLAGIVRRAAGKTHPLTPGVEMTATDKGYCLVQTLAFMDAARRSEPPRASRFDVQIDGETVRGVPVQYFTFLYRDGNQWMAKTISHDGAVTTEKVNGTT